MSDTPMKRCSKGDDCVHPDGCWQPATSEYFHRDSKSIDGLRASCKNCRKKISKTYYQNNRDGILEYEKKYRENNREAISARSREYNKRNREQKREYNQAYYKENREAILIQKRGYAAKTRKQKRTYNQNYYHKNRKAILEQKKQYRQENLEEIRHRNRRYYHENRNLKLQKMAEYRKKNYKKLRQKWLADTKKYRITRPVARRLSIIKLRTIKAGLPYDYSVKAWERCLEYFDYSCAYCGAERDLFIGLDIEHFYPLSSDSSPGSIATNLIPACRSKYPIEGHIGCNQSKGNKPPKDWLTQRFGEKEAARILKRIHAYFEWVVEQDDTD